MSSAQDIVNAVSLIPNGNFAQGVAYWSGSPDKTGLHFKHLKFVTDHEGDSAVKDGEPKYGLSAYETVFCNLTRNDLFVHPVRRYLVGLTGVPMDSKTLLVAASPADAFYTEAIDHATAYDAGLNTGGDLKVVISKDTQMSPGTRLVWLRPNGEWMALTLGSEDRNAAGVDYRAFRATRSDGNPITAGDVGNNVSTVRFVVRARVRESSAVTVESTVDGASGTYVVQRVADTSIVITPDTAVLPVKASTGDVGGLVYSRTIGATHMTVRVLSGSLYALGVRPGDYFTAFKGGRAYGRIDSVSSGTGGVEELSVSVSGAPLPTTAPGAYVAIAKWAIVPVVPLDLDVELTGVRYELTLALTARKWETAGTAPNGWGVTLEFTEEEGAPQGTAKVIDSMTFSKIRSFVVSSNSLYKRYIYRLIADRPLPVMGLPRLKLNKPGGGLSTFIEISHISMFRGDYTGMATGDSPAAVFDDLGYSAAPDGGLLPRGVCIPCIGGSSCPPGFKEMIGVSGDSNTTGPSVVEHVFNPFTWEPGPEYDIANNVTTLVIKTDMSKDGFSYYPWSSSKMLLPVKMRSQPGAPVYSFKIKIDGYTITLFSLRLPSPPARPQRYEYVEVGSLVPKFVPGMFLQVIDDKLPGTSFVPNKPHAPDGVYNILINRFLVIKEFDAYEEGWNTKSWPSSYNALYTEIDFNAFAPTPDGIMTAINLTRNLYDNISRAALYSPRRVNEPLPTVFAEPVKGGATVTHIELVGDWRHLFKKNLDAGRIISSGYVRADPDSPGVVDPGSEEHNHRVARSDLVQIFGAAVKVDGTLNGADKPPVAVGHGHGYLGAGSFSRPRARCVKLCVKL